MTEAQGIPPAAAAWALISVFEIAAWGGAMIVSTSIPADTIADVAQL